MTKETKKTNLQSKPPVVVILGHVDHGKSSILEKIKDLKITEKESGGITQHIGAYEVEYQGKKITFIDTPGHEAFSAMRSRGAQVADIIVLVVAAEEGVKPQTKEAITYIKKTGLPAIVAINKIDKKEAQPEKVKQELAENGLVVESLGGEVPAVNLSAKTGQGINDLLEMILLVAEIAELKADFNKPASGVVIESYQDSRRGATATLLIKEGTLRDGDIIGTNSAAGKIKTLEDFQFKPLKKATPSQPVIVTGFNKVPQVGEKFLVFETLQEAQERIQRKNRKQPHLTSDKEVLMIEPGKKILNLILKTDVQGSIEAIKAALKSIPSEEAIPRILKSEVGEITESDIKLAESAQARIIGFRIPINPNIKQIAKQRGVKIFAFEVIYELIQNIREQLAKLLEPEIVRHDLGTVKILAIFRKEKERQIIGGKVLQGQIKKGAQVEIVRDDKKIGKGKIIQLQRDKKDIEEVSKGQECGILLQSSVSIEKGDILEVFEEEKRQKTI